MIRPKSVWGYFSFVYLYKLNSFYSSGCVWVVEKINLELLVELRKIRF